MPTFDLLCLHTNHLGARHFYSQNPTQSEDDPLVFYRTFGPQEFTSYPVDN